MKKAVKISLALILIYCGSYAQNPIPAPPCEQIEIGNISIINKFIQDCIKHREFINNKGIVRLTESRNSKGLLCWRLSATIDDGYKSNPPTKFADIDGDIVIIYEADSLGRRSQNPNPEAYNKCLENVIGDRVYLRPTIKTRWSSSMKKIIVHGEPVKRGMDRHMLDGGVEWFIVFNKDGTYKINY